MQIFNEMFTKSYKTILSTAVESSKQIATIFLEARSDRRQSTLMIKSRYTASHSYNMYTFK